MRTQCGHNADCPQKMRTHADRCGQMRTHADTCGHCESKLRTSILTPQPPRPQQPQQLQQQRDTNASNSSGSSSSSDTSARPQQRQQTNRSGSSSSSVYRPTAAASVPLRTPTRRLPTSRAAPPHNNHSYDSSDTSVRQQQHKAYRPAAAEQER